MCCKFELRIQNFVNDPALNGKNIVTGAPLSEKTVIHHLTFISDVFNYAVRLGRIKENPCRRVVCPRDNRTSSSVQDVSRRKSSQDRLQVDRYRQNIHPTEWRKHGNPYPVWVAEKFTAKNGLRFCAIHSLRHFHASLLIDSGVDLTTVSRELGHSTVSTTANIYSHQLELAQAKTSEVMSAALLS